MTNIASTGTAVRVEPASASPLETGAVAGGFGLGLASIRHAPSVHRPMTTKIAIPLVFAAAAAGIATGENALVRAVTDSDDERAAHVGIAAGGALGWAALHVSRLPRSSPIAALAQSGLAIAGVSSTAGLLVDGAQAASDQLGVPGSLGTLALASGAAGAGLLVARRVPASMRHAVALEAGYAREMAAAGVGPLHQRPGLEVDTGRLLRTVPWDPSWKGSLGYSAAATTVPGSKISALLGEPAVDPSRIIVPYEAAATVQGRVDLALKSIDETNALDRAELLIDSPAVGYIHGNFVAGAEIASRGDQAMVSVAFYNRQAKEALGEIDAARDTQRLLLQGIKERLDARVANGESIPRVTYVGNSIGTKGASDVALAGGVSRLDDYGIDRMFLFGAPSFSSNAWKVVDRAARTGGDSPDAIRYASEAEYLALPQRARDSARIHVITNYDDPVQIRPRDFWMKQPVGEHAVEPGIEPFVPGLSGLRRVEDVVNHGLARPGILGERGHDHRLVSFAATRHAAAQPLTDEQGARLVTFGDEAEKWIFGMGPDPLGPHLPNAGAAS